MSPLIIDDPRSGTSHSGTSHSDPDLDVDMNHHLSASSPSPSDSSALSASSEKSSLLPIELVNNRILRVVISKLSSPDDLFSLRLVSRRFHDLATPIAFHTIHLNPHLIHPDAPRRTPDTFAHIAAYTRHVVAYTSLNADSIAAFLARVSRLESLRWVYVTEDDDHNGLPAAPLNPDHDRLDFPAHILGANFGANSAANHNRNYNFYNSLTGHGSGGRRSSHLLPHRSDPVRFANTDLYIDKLPLESFWQGDFRDSNAVPHSVDNPPLSIPTRHLVSLTLSPPQRPMVSCLTALLNLLILSPRLRTFHFHGRGIGSSFSFPPRLDTDPAQGPPRLPAFHDLVLRSYTWMHDREVVDLYWDFSRIRSLQLLSVTVSNFFQSVDMAQLADLRRLRCEDFSSHLPNGCRTATLLLSTFLTDHARHLRHLHLTCDVSVLDINGVIAQTHLRTLALYDDCGYNWGRRRCPTLSAPNMLHMAARMRCLREIELDFDPRESDDGMAFRHALAQFPSLEAVTLHVPTLVSSRGEDHDGEDPPAPSPPLSEQDPLHFPTDFEPKFHYYLNLDLDRHAALRLVYTLIVLKRAFNPDIPTWRRIEIQVGGWRKRGTVRKVEDTWERYNRVGTFVERRFVFERPVDVADRVDWEVGMQPDLEPGQGLCMWEDDREMGEHRFMSAAFGEN